MRESPTTVRVDLLGVTRVLRDGAEVAIRARKDRALLGEVALRARLPRDEALALLWPDSDEERARDSLRHALWRIRNALGEAAIVSEADELRIGGSVAVDVREFERACAGDDPDRLARALEIYRGDLAKELEGADAEAERTRLRALLADAGLRLATARLAEDPAAAIASARAVLRHDPYREDLYRIVYEAHARSGDRGALSAEHRRVTALLRRELGVEPSAETRALYARLITLEPAVEAASRARRPDVASPSRLVGRGTEHRHILQLVVDGIDGKGRALLVLGEAGAGKSALLDEAIRISREHGIAVACSRAAGAAGELAFQLWRDALRPYAAEIAALPSPWPRVVAALVPTGAEAVEAGTVAPQVERARLFEGVARALSALGARGPLLVALDDLHWADADSLQLLHYLIRTLRGERVAFLAATRLGESRDLDEWRTQLRRADLLDEVELSSLDADAVRQLLEQAEVGGETAGWLAPRLRAWTAGNPLFVVESIRSLIEQGSLRRAAAGLEWSGARPREEEQLTAVPAGVRQTIASRLGALPAEARQLLGVAAALGRAFAPAELAAATGRDELAILEALEPAFAARVLRDDVIGGRPEVAFGHDLVRDAIYQQLSPVMRVAIHRRVAAALESRGAPAATLAHHFIASSEPARALPHWITAAREAEAAFAHEAALRAYESALALVPAGAVDERSTILEEKGDVEVRRGVVSEALRAYDEALLSVGRDDADRIARLQVKIAFACGRHYGEHPRALEYAEAGVRYFERTRPESAEMADALLALMAMQYRARLRHAWGPAGGHPDEAETKAASRARALCRRLDLPRQEAAALSIEAWSRYASGEATYTPERADIERLVARLGDDDEAAMLLLSMARPAQRRGDFATARDHALAALRIAVRVGSLRAEEAATEVLEKAYLRSGRWADAIAMSDRRLAILPRMASPDVVDPLVTRAWAEALSGDVEAARATARRLAAALGRTPQEPLEHMATAAAALGVYVLTELPEFLPTPLGSVPPRPRCNSCIHLWLAQAGPVLAVYGDPSAALGAADELEMLVASSGFGAAAGFAPLMRAVALRRLGRDTESAVAFSAAERAFRSTGDALGAGLLSRLIPASTPAPTSPS